MEIPISLSKDSIKLPHYKTQYSATILPLKWRVTIAFSEQNEQSAMENFSSLILPPV